MLFEQSKMENIEKPHEHGSDCDHDHDREYLLDYPMGQRKCIAALEKLQEDRLKVEAEFRAEVQELERKYLAKFAPIHLDRAAIVNGERQPKPEEYGQIPEDVVTEVDDKGEPCKTEESTGIPEFWLTILKNHPALGNLVFEDDEKALKALKDIRVNYLESGPGFRLDFHFESNEYFTNQVLSKEYHLVNPTTAGHSEMVYDHATGTEISWKDGKNLCFKTVTKTQRQKNGSGTRIVKRQEPAESFFHFFSPPDVPEDDESDADIEELEEELEADYEAGDIIKSDIVPNAVDWFTGKAMEYADYYDEEEGEGEYDSEEDSDEDDESGSEDDSDDSASEAPRRPRNRAAGKGPAAPSQDQAQNCKQQ